MNKDAVVLWQEERTVSRALTILYRKVVYFLEPTALVGDLYGKRVIVCQHVDGTITITYDNTALLFHVFDKVRHVRPVDIISNKRLANILKAVQEQQKARPMSREAKSGYLRKPKQP